MMQEAIREIQVIGRSTRERIVSAQQCPALRAHGVLSAGVSDTEPGYEFARRWPGFGTLLVCHSGMGMALSGDKWKEIPPGAAFSAPPSRPHHYRNAPGLRWGIAWCTFEPGRWPGHWDKAELRPVDPDILWFAISGLHAECNGCMEPSAVAGWSALVGLSAARAFDARWAGDERLVRLWREVDAAPDRQWSLRELAGVVHLSSEQLRVLCLRHTGQPPMAHVAAIRMRRAAVLLEMHRGIKLLELAQAVGYLNEFAFSSAFKRIMGTPPSRWRGVRPGSEREVVRPD